MRWAAKRPPSADERAVMNLIAAVREVSEYQIFVDAYREWHGRDAEESSLEADFGRYLRSGQVPEFVRQYLRNYQERNPQAMASYRRRLRNAERIRRIAFWVIVLMVILALGL